MILFADRRQAGKELADRVADYLADHDYDHDHGHEHERERRSAPEGAVAPAAAAVRTARATADTARAAPESPQPSSPDLHAPDLLVLGLPRGGVPVAAAVADRLHAPLDAFTVRKLGAPWQPEFAIGAIATGGTRVVNPQALDQLGVSKDELAALVEQEGQEVRRRERLYRDDRPFPPIVGRTVIVVDDGLATGATMIAAARALRSAHPARLIAAVPVASGQGLADLRREVDAVICLDTPEPFQAVGCFYRHFGATEDDEVRGLLAAAPAPT
jgi:putative phosphoribosyl transferase